MSNLKGLSWFKWPATHFPHKSRTHDKVWHFQCSLWSNLQLYDFTAIQDSTTQPWATWSDLIVEPAFSIMLDTGSFEVLTDPNALVTVWYFKTCLIKRSTFPQSSYICSLHPEDSFPDSQIHPLQVTYPAWISFFKASMLFRFLS